MTASGNASRSEFLTVEEAGKLPHISRDKIYYLLRTGQLHSIAALTELDEGKDWADLSPIERSEDQRIVHLCREHVRAMDYPYRA